MQNSFQKLLKNPNFQKQYATIKEDVLADAGVQLFLTNHKEQITDAMIEKSLMKLYEYTTQSRGCMNCESVEACQNMMQGFEPVLVLQKNYIDLAYEPCKKKRLRDEKKKHTSLIQSLSMPKDVLTASMADLELDDPARFDAIKQARDFVRHYLAGDEPKGLYLHGSFGVGKTYILGAIANELAEGGTASMIVYTPELMREMKNSLQDQSLNRKVDVIKKSAVLMFDDIGAESMSSWMRDDILGPILQYRMMEKLPTCFTSNMNYTQLQHHFAYSQRGEVEELKAARILERIKELTTAVELQGRNRRRA